MAMMYPDISHHHPVTDWALAKKNCSFLISKATEGQTFVDSTLKSFISGCEKNKIPYWLYTYLRNGNELKQTQFMVKTCEPLVGKYFVGYILDIEENNSAANVKPALSYLDGLGVKTMLYTGYADYNSYKTLISGRPANCAWWEARYGKNNGIYNAAYPPHTGVDLHQYTSYGSCPGISGRCDLNRILKKDLSWYTTPLNGTPVEPPKPVSVTLDVLQRGSKGASVKALQILLNGYGYSCGNADGDFGDKTDAAVEKFQKAKKLTVDGIVGKSTWEKLLK